MRLGKDWFFSLHLETSAVVLCEVISADPSPLQKPSLLQGNIASEGGQLNELKLCSSSAAVVISGGGQEGASCKGSVYLLSKNRKM